MSRRFGRNQKRQMRERIENLENAVNMNRALLRDISDSLCDVRSELEDARTMAKSMSTIFPPEEVYVDRDMTYNVNVADVKVANFFDFSQSAFSVIDRTPLSVLITQAEKSKMDNSTHVRVRFKDGMMGYAMSDVAFESTPKDFLIKRISEEIAVQLVNHLRPK